MACRSRAIVTRFIASFLFGVKPHDPMVFVAVSVTLSGVALLAVWLRQHCGAIPSCASNYLEAS